MLWDRLCWRREGDKISEETAHRDISAFALPQDEIFGGWLNLDVRPQYFHCVPGSQWEAGGDARGFVREAEGDAQERMRRVEVPPGHLVVFYQQLLHTVPKGEVPEDSYRLF